jgi:transposase
MEHDPTFVGLDVHVETIAIAVCRGVTPPQELGTIHNEIGTLLKRLRKLGPLETLAVCYEAGPCGYTLYRQLTMRGIACTVVAPSLIPVRPGNRVKTDRRDALNLARLHRSGDLTAVAVPSPEVEAIRDRSRLRQAAMEELHRNRQRLLKLFPRIDMVEPRGFGRWTKRYHAWLAGLTVTSAIHQVVLDDLRAVITAGQERLDALTAALLATATEGALAPVVTALQELHGVGAIIAIGLVAELGDLTRFDRAPQVMADAGVVPREHSSGGSTQRGHITKAGNAHVRRLLVEAAWHYARPAREREPADTSTAQIAATARARLRRRYLRLVSRGKPNGIAIVAVARELLGCCWGMAQALREEAPTIQAVAA